VSVLVVGAHPCHDSFVAAVGQRVVIGLERSGRSSTVVDLYGEGWDPGAGLPERHLRPMSEARSLVLVHPTWWTSQPALLLAWLGEAVGAGLPELRSIVSVTTLGGSRLANRLAGESGARVVSHIARHRCPSRPVHRRLALYGVDRSTAARRVRFLGEVERRIGALAQ
jgi:putative NADPH-quinone reductase